MRKWAAKGYASEKGWEPLLYLAYSGDSELGKERSPVPCPFFCACVITWKASGSFNTGLDKGGFACMSQKASFWWSEQLVEADLFSGQMVCKAVALKLVLQLQSNQLHHQQFGIPDFGGRIAPQKQRHVGRECPTLQNQRCPSVVRLQRLSWLLRIFATHTTEQFCLRQQPS